MKTLPNLKNKPYGGVWSIHDPELKSWIRNELECYPQPNVPEFLADYTQWIQESNTIIGLADYKSVAYSNGTTEAFDKFYMIHGGGRLRLWRGEYMYHLIQARETFREVVWIDDDPVFLPGDVVAVSMPFSDTGNIPDNYDSVMQQCSEQNIPALVDMAYLSLTNNMTYNISYPCIKTVTTSLSKIFPVEHFRIGIRFNRDLTDDTLDAYTNQPYPYLNLTGVHLGHKLINHYQESWLYKRWQTEQTKWCNKLNVTPSNCVILGIDTEDNYPEYNRGGATNRLCFSKHWDKRI